MYKDFRDYILQRIYSNTQSQFSTKNHEACKETRKYCSVTERKGKKRKKLTKAIPEKAQTLDLLGKHFISTILKYA